MMLPPAIVRLRLRHHGGGWPTLWLPLFLLWPLLFVSFVLATTLGVLVLSVTGQVSATNALGVCAGVYRLLCATRGTHVDVVGHERQVLISVY